MSEVEYTDKWGEPGTHVVTDRDYDPGAARDEASVFLQWKGTDACFDLRCRCGAGTHFDGYFAYAVECGNCGQRYAMPMTVTLKPLTGVPVDSTEEKEHADEQR